MLPPPPRPTLFPSRRSSDLEAAGVDVTGDQISDRRALAAIGDRVELETGEMREQEIGQVVGRADAGVGVRDLPGIGRSEEHTSELQSQSNLVCRLLLEKKNK